MDSIYYGLALLAILLIIRWYITNDGKGQDDGSLGFLALKSSELPAGKLQSRRSFRRQP